MYESTILQSASRAPAGVQPGRHWASAPVWALVVSAVLLVVSPAHAQTWEWVGPQPDSRLVDAVWDGQRLLAVDWRSDREGHQVSSRIWTSADGAIWRETARPNRGLDSIAWNGSVYVAVGDGVLSSPDGVTWTDRTPAGWARDWPHRVIWTGQRFVSVGGQPQIATSPDGIVWATQTVADVGDLAAVASNGRTLVAVGYSDRVMTSPDGLTWASAPGPSSDWLTDVCWIGNKFVAVTRKGSLFVTPDGTSWSKVADLEYWQPWRLGWNGSLAVAVGDGVFTSTDGEHWTERVPVDDDEYSITPRSIAWTGTRWSVGGFLTSPDGLSWHDWRFSLAAGATSGDTEVAVGADGAMLANRSGAGWTYCESPTTASLATVVWDGTQFLAAGAQRALVTSADGVAWEHHTSGLDADIVRLVWSGSRFVALLEGGGLAHSPDGVNWALATTGAGFADVASAGWKLVAVGKAGLVATSHDGATWTSQPPPTSVDLTGVTWTGRSFIAVGPGPTVLRSADSERWQPELAPTASPTRGCTISSLDSVASERDVLLLWTTSICSGRVRPTYWQSSDARGWISPVTLWLGPTRDSRVRTGRHLTVLGQNWIQRAEVSERRIVVPMAAHTQGINGTFWRTDVEVLNRGSEVARFEVELLPRAGSVGAMPAGSYVVQPGASRRLRDILHDHQGAGALRVRTLVGQIEVESHTATDSVAGTLGQLVPGILEEEAFSSGQAARLVGLSQASDRSAGFRSNLGIVNLAKVPIGLTVAIHSPSGALLGTIQETAPPGSLLQLDEFIRRVTTAPMPAAYALASSSTPGAAFLAWASVVDNRTGDPTLVMAR